MDDDRRAIALLPCLPALPMDAPGTASVSNTKSVRPVRCRIVSANLVSGAVSGGGAVFMIHD